MARKLSMDPRAVRLRAERAAAKEAKRQALASGIEQPEAPAIEVAASEPEAPKTLKEKLFGFIKAEETTAKKQTRTRKGADNLLTTALPTVAASFIATYSQQLLAEEYRRCAPSQAEVSAILGPIMDIIGRRVEIVGKASQDAIDMANAILAGFMYSTRAYIAYVEIKRGNHAEKKESDARDAAGDRTIRADQSTRTGAGRPGTNGTDSTRQPEAARVDHVNGAGSLDDAEATAGRDVDLISQMLQRDRTGRVGLGLLPGVLPGANNNAHPAD